MGSGSWRSRIRRSDTPPVAVTSPIGTKIYGGECIAAFRPNTVSTPTRNALYRYEWDGAAVRRVLTISEIREFPPPAYRVA